MRIAAELPHPLSAERRIHASPKTALRVAALALGLTTVGVGAAHYLDADPTFQNTDKRVTIHPHGATGIPEGMQDFVLTTDPANDEKSVDGGFSGVPVFPAPNFSEAPLFYDNNPVSVLEQEYGSPSFIPGQEFEADIDGQNRMVLNEWYKVTLPEGVQSTQQEGYIPGVYLDGNPQL